MKSRRDLTISSLIVYISVVCNLVSSSTVPVYGSLSKHERSKRAPIPWLIFPTTSPTRVQVCNGQAVPIVSIDWFFFFVVFALVRLWYRYTTGRSWLWSCDHGLCVKSRILVTRNARCIAYGNLYADQSEANAGICWCPPTSSHVRELFGGCRWSG